MAGIGAGVIVKHNHDQAVTRQRAAARVEQRERRSEMAEEARLRRADELKLERTIASDARELAEIGKLDGPILGATCSPMSGGSAANLSSSTGSFNCIAIRKRRGRTIEGARFFGTIDFRSGNYTFRGD